MALGAPKQEIWMYEHRNRIHALMIGVGAGFDFLAGTVKRAPMWMQKLCLEWVYRIFQDPKRMIPRYLNTNFAFMYYTHKESRQLAKQKKKAGQTAEIKAIFSTRKAYVPNCRKKNAYILFPSKA